MLYEIVTGRQAFVGATEFARLTMIMNAEPEPPSSVLGVLVAFDAFFKRALQKDRAHRFQSAAEMSQALASISLPISIVPPSGRASVSPVGPTMSSSNDGGVPASYHPPPPIVVMPGTATDPSSFAGGARPRGVSQIIVVLLVSFALMAGFVLGFAVARNM